MTDFLTIAGTPYPVQTQNAQESERQYSGERTRAFANNLVSSKDPLSKRREWTFVLGPVTRAVYDALHAATDGDTAVVVGGDAIGAVAVSCFVDVTGTYARDGTGHMVVVAISVHEV